MGIVRHIECAQCAGEVGFAEFERVITCSYCGTRMLADNPDWVSEYRIEPEVDEVAARRALQRFLMEPEMPRGLMRLMRFKDAELCYAPYNDIRLRRLGTMETTIEKSLPRSSYPVEEQSITRSFMGGLMSHSDAEPFLSGRAEKTVNRETTVVIGDIHRVEPAVQIADLGLQFTAAATLLKESRASLVPFVRETVARNARIFQPSISPATIVEQMSVTGPIDLKRDQTAFVEVRTRRVFYPLWRLRYTLAGREYSATVDAVSAELLTARAPENDRNRILALLGVVALFGFFTGRGIHFFMQDHNRALAVSAGTRAISTEGFWAIPLVVLLLAASLVVIAGWARFRYPAEVVKRGSSKTIEKLGESFSPVRRRLSQVFGIDAAESGSEERRPS